MKKLYYELLGAAADLDLTIHEADQMYTFIAATRGSREIARAEYLKSGALTMQVVEQLIRWKFGSFDKVRAFLDFASGYGRFTRFLVQKLPAARIWISEIQADAVAFQQEQFGVHGLLSTSDPAALQCTQRFDCIFVSSLFSHLPEATFVPWLTKLYSWLRPDGLLIFSVHDETWLNPADTLPETGIWFKAANEIDSLDANEYGTSIVTEAFMRKAIAQASGGNEAYLRIKRGLYSHQDLYLVINSATPDFSGLQFNYGAAGTVDRWRWTPPDELQIEGWTADLTPGSAVEEVRIFLNGQPRQQCRPTLPRPDIRDYLRDERHLYTGWECGCHLPHAGATDLLSVKALSSSGAEGLLFLSPLGALMSQTNVVTEPEEEHAQIAYLKAELNTRLRYIHRLEATLERKDEALRDLETRIHQLEAELISVRTPRLPWKRPPRKS